MIWLIGCGGIVASALSGGWFLWRQRRSKPDAATYHVMVALHVIRRRFDVFQFRVEARHDYAHTRCRLGEELNELRRRERQL
jgi:hypothetical protein